MKNNIFKILMFIIFIITFLYLQMYFIMYNIQIKNVTNGGVMLSIFGQDFVYEYEYIEE